MISLGEICLLPYARSSARDRKDHPVNIFGSTWAPMRVGRWCIRDDICSHPWIDIFQVIKNWLVHPPASERGKTKFHKSRSMEWDANPFWGFDSIKAVFFICFSAGTMRYPPCSFLHSTRFCAFHPAKAPISTQPIKEDSARWMVCLGFKGSQDFYSASNSKFWKTPKMEQLSLIKWWSYYPSCRSHSLSTFHGIGN